MSVSGNLLHDLVGFLDENFHSRIDAEAIAFGERQRQSKGRGQEYPRYTIRCSNTPPLSAHQWNQ